MFNCFQNSPMRCSGGLGPHGRRRRRPFVQLFLGRTRGADCRALSLTSRLRPVVSLIFSSTPAGHPGGGGRLICRALRQTVPAAYPNHCSSTYFGPNACTACSAWYQGQLQRDRRSSVDSVNGTFTRVRLERAGRTAAPLRWRRSSRGAAMPPVSISTPFRFY